MDRSHNTCIAVGILICLALAACANLPLADQPSATVITEKQLPMRVAILPFVNRTPNPEAADIVRKMFYNFFGSLNYLDLEPSLIDAKLKQQQLFESIGAGATPSLIELGQLLGVDAVVTGEVTSLGKLYALVYADNQAGLKARMVNCATGDVVWEMEHTVHQREGDVPLSLTGLAATIIKTAINHQQATHVQAAAQLCMQMVTTIPNPPAVDEQPPGIQVLVHNGAGRLLRAGDSLKIVLVGDRNMTAGWSLAPLISNQPLQEIEPGVYAGSYRVRQSDRLSNGRIIGHLKSKSGVDSRWIDTLGEVKIGAPVPLPEMVSKDTRLTAARSPYLVSKALVVMPGAKLVIEPGTVIWFEQLGMIVRGELQVLGSAQAPVQFGRLGSTAWKGIFFDHSRGENTMQYCDVSGAQYGLRAIASDLVMTHCRFRENEWGMVIESGRASVSHSLFRTSAKTGIAARRTELNLSESIITENMTGGLMLESSHASINTNNIANNGGWQLKILDDKGQISADNNWWGRRSPTEIDVIGSVKLGRVLDKPLDFSANPTSP